MEGGWLRRRRLVFTTGIPLRKPAVLIRILSFFIEGKNIRIGYVNFTLKQRTRQAEHCYPLAASARHSAQSEM